MRLLAGFLSRFLGRVSSEDEKRVCPCETRLQREHLIKNFHCPTRECASLWTEQEEQAEQEERVSSASEQT